MKTRSCAGLLASVLLVVAGCSSPATTIPQVGSRAGQAFPIAIQLTVPATTAMQSHSRHSPQFVAANTGGILAQTFAQSDTAHATTLGQTATDITPGSSACSGQSGAVRTCTFSVSAPAGADTLVITSYDGAPAAGSFSGKNQLAAAALNLTVSSTAANTANVTLGGIVKSLQVVVPHPTIHGTVASSQNVIVEAFDVDGNFIATDAYVDASGNPVSVSLAVSPNTGSVFNLASATVTGANATGVALSYNGSAASAFSTTITASAGSISAHGTVALLGPSFTEYPTTTAAAGIGGLGVAGNGAQSTSLFFTEPAVNKIGIITLGGVITEVSPGGTTPQSIIAGPTGVSTGANEMYYTASGSSQIEGMDVSGTAFSGNATATAGAAPLGITKGPDQNIWFTESSVSKIGVLKLSTFTASDFPTITAAANPQYIVAGSDGRLWFTEKGANKIGAITTAGTVTEYAVPTAASQPAGITEGDDGNAWFTEQGANKVAMITPSGAVTEFAVPTASAGLATITAGADGNLWFLESGASQLGRISLQTHVITEYKTPTTSTLAGIVAGPDGNLWFGENGASKVATFAW